jgi:hypothetical protein
MARSRNTADTQTASGGPVSPFVAGKNVIINGDFSIWQRGTSITGTGTETFSADRFLWVGDGSGGTRTFSRQTMGYGDIPGYEYPHFLRFNQSVAGSGASYNYLCQRIENANAFAGQTVTFSFWAKASASTTLPAIYARQRFGSGGSAETSTTVTSNIAVTTSWQRFSYTFAVPSIAGKTVGTGSYLTMDVYHPINTTFTVDTFGWQLEAGSAATPFETATGTIQGELAACQRYYEKGGVFTATPGAAGSLGEMWFPNATIANNETWQAPRFAVTKRSSPSVTTYSYNGTSSRAANDSGTDYGADSANVWRANESGFVIKNNSGSSMTVTSVRWVYCNWVASAEL